MAIKINDNTVTGDIYYNGDKVQKVYIDNKLAWTSKPTVEITVLVFRKNPLGFRLVADADRNVNSDVTIILSVGGEETSITIHAGSKTAITPWLPGYANVAILLDYYPTEDSEYKYIVFVEDPVTSEPMFNNIVTGYCYTELDKTYHQVRAIAQYPVGAAGIYCSFNTGIIWPAVYIEPFTRIGSYWDSYTGAYICEWVGLSPDYDDSYYYIQGPTYFVDLSS